MSFKKYLEKSGKSKSTISHYTTYLLDFISHLDKDNVETENATAKEVLSYLNKLKAKGLENQTRSIRLGVIKQYFNWQINQELRTENPIAHLKIRGSKTHKLYNLLDAQQLGIIYNSYAIPDDKHPKANCNWFYNYQLSKQRNKTILNLLFNQGLTTIEIERLTLENLNLKDGQIYIIGSRKSNERTLELKSNQIMELMQYVTNVRPLFTVFQKDQDTQRLFLSAPAAGKETANDTLQIWKGLTKEIKAQYEQFKNFKQVRASIITKWLGQYNLRQVQYMAGHRFVSSTEKYLVNHTEDLQADIDQFHPI